MSTNLKEDGLGASLVRTLAHALRHDPAQHGIELDEQGWAELEELVANLKERFLRWAVLTCEDVEEFVRTEARGRFECRAGRVRALYGHSVPGVCAGVEEAPPSVLHHGTRGDWVAEIERVGLRPMGRTYVHLTSDVQYAGDVGAAKSCNWVILGIDATAACDDGIRFFRANHHVWQTAFVPPKFVRGAKTRAWVRGGTVQAGSRRVRTLSDPEALSLWAEDVAERARLPRARQANVLPGVYQGVLDEPIESTTCVAAGARHGGEEGENGGCAALHTAASGECKSHLFLTERRILHALAIPENP